jgi:hypothetical protein
VGTLQRDGDPPAAPVPGRASRFVPLGPTRLVDTRLGLGAPAGTLPDGGTLDVRVAGVAGVPDDATAVAVNVTATGSTGAGWVQAAPTGGAPPGSSSTLNLDRAGQTIPNLAIVPLGEGGSISVRVQTATDVVVDLLGAFEPAGAVRAGRFVAVGPARVLDTRTGLGVAPAPDPVASDAHVVEAGGVVHLAVPGVPASATAVALNVTATGAAGDGYVQVVPAGGSIPLGTSSNLNTTAGATSANLVLVGVQDGAVDLYAQVRTHLVADVVGYVTGDAAPASTAGRFVPYGPARVLDTRDGGRPGDGGRVAVPLAGLPTGGGSAAVLLNVTATGAAAPGFVQAAPAGAGLGASSTLNVVPGQTVANAAVVAVAPGGPALLVQSSTDLVADVGGWFTGADPGADAA